MQRARRVLLGASAVLLMAAAACGSPSTPGQSASPSPGASTPAASTTPSASTKPITASTNLDAITATGAYGKLPTVKFKAPWAVDKTRAEVLIKGPASGPTLKSGQTVSFNYVGINARTGKKFDDSFSRGTPLVLPIDQLVAGFGKGLIGQKQGSRVLLAIPGPDGYDASGGRPDSGINVGDTLIFVVDLVAVPLEGPEGEAVAPKAGLPTVTDSKGVPSVEIPKGDPPKSAEYATLIKGTGAKVAATDTITFNYRWYGWDGRVIEDSYKTGKAGSAQLSTLLTGIGKGLTGQTVGSRVLMVIPDAYPSGNTDPKVGKGEAVVFVIDLLFTQPAQ